MTEPDPIDWGDLEQPEPTAPDDEATPAPARRPSPVKALPSEPQVDAETLARRARVLRHPDIAARLTQAPHRFSRPENWTGYLPPAMWREQPNDSPQRKGLLEILAAVEEREAAS